MIHLKIEILLRTKFAEYYTILCRSQLQLEQMAAPNYSKMTEIDSGDRVRGVIVTGREKQPSNGLYY